MSQALLVAITALVLGLFGWASQSTLDQVIRAEAKVAPVQDVIQVQNRFAGTLVKVYVALGDRVSKGQVLFEIDPEESSIDLAQVELSLALQRARLETLNAMADRREPVYAETLAAVIRQQEVRLLHARRQDLRHRLAVLNHQSRALAVRQAESNTITASAREQLALTDQEIELLAPLVTMGAEPKIKLIGLRQRRSELAERAAVNQLASERTQIELEGLRTQSEQLQGAFDLEVEQEQDGVLQEIARLENELERAQQRTARSQILSPVDGLVTDLPNSVAGQIAQAGSILAELVPLDGLFEVEARVRPVDVALVSPGQPARVSLAAYDFAEYGHLSATVTEVAQNLTEPPQGEPFYRAVLSLDTQAFSKSGEAVTLIPGMLGQVDLLGEPVTVLSYLTNPVVRVTDRALSEQ